jgi:hypothetical protein
MPDARKFSENEKAYNQKKIPENLNLSKVSDLLLLLNEIVSTVSS